jgi:hypothetical protein
MPDFTDALICLILLAILFGVAYMYRLIQQLDVSKVAMYCEKGLSYQVKKGSLSSMVPSDFEYAPTVLAAIGTSPPEDTQIKFKFNCK